MISGIHLATALSVMLHMEQEGDEMGKMNKTDDLADRLRKADYDTPYVWDLTAEAADRLSEQQQVIDALSSRLEFISLALTDHGYSDYGPMKEAVTSALSLAKGHTKDAE